MTPFVFAALLRVSGDQQVESGSYADQKRRILKHFEEKGWKLSEDRIYGDPAVSGTITDREGLLRLQADARAGKFNVLVVTKQDRLTRAGENVFGSIMTVLQDECFIQLYEVQNPHQLQDPATFIKPDVGLRVTRAVNAIFADQDREVIIKNTFQGRQRESRLGRAMYPVAPYGYQFIYITEENNKPVRHLDINPLEYPHVKTIISLALQGYSDREIVKHCKRYDLLPPPRSAEAWTAGSIKKIIRSPVHYGKIKYGEIVADHHYPTHFNWDDYMVIQLMREDRRTPPATATGINPFAGILRCLECNSGLLSHTTKAAPTLMYLMCNKRDNGKDLCPNGTLLRSDVVVKRLWVLYEELASQYIADPKTFIQQMASLPENQLTAALKDIDKRTAALKVKQDNLDEALLNGLAAPKYNELNDKLEGERKTLEKERHSLTALRERELETVARVKRVGFLFEQWAEHHPPVVKHFRDWSEHDRETIKHLSHSVFSRIIVHVVGEGHKKDCWLDVTFRV